MKTLSNHIKLGAFVLAGMFFLVLLLYMIGKNRNMFGSHLTLRAVFTDADGLKPGNNVRYAGIEIGTVSYVRFLSDTAVEVGMTISDQAAGVIHRNAMASVGTDGLVGNRVVNLKPGPDRAPLVGDGDLLVTGSKPDLEKALRTLAATNEDVAQIAAQLKQTVVRINQSTALWQLLNDASIPSRLHGSLRNIMQATARADSISATLQYAVGDLKNGRGLLGALLYDTSAAAQLQQALSQFRQVGRSTDSLVMMLSGSIGQVNSEIQNGKGVLHSLLKDTALAGSVSRSLQHIENGTDGFNKNMEALKHNFLFRGYFRKLEKEEQKLQRKNAQVKPRN